MVLTKAHGKTLFDFNPGSIRDDQHIASHDSYGDIILSRLYSLDAGQHDAGRTKDWAGIGKYSMRTTFATNGYVARTGKNFESMPRRVCTTQ